tara:strand:+ start:33 stop:368 length:336 start_codon:yes stop_codon:yes gene_type:complete
MNNFYQWLETQSNISFGRFSDDGTISVYINGSKYIYLTDPIYHKKWVNLARYAPFRVLNMIKKQVEMGHARLLDQPNRTLKYQSNGEKASCPNCKTPYPHYVPDIECPGCA